MFIVIYLGPGAGASNVIVYAGFASWAAAEGFVASRDFPGNYYVAQVFGPIPTSPPSAMVPQAVAPGNYIALLVTSGATGAPRCIGYGTFTAYANAAAFIAAQPFPAGFSVRQCLAAPA